MKIKNFKSFLKTINEINTAGTYLDPSKIRKEYSSEKTSSFRYDQKGIQFEMVEEIDDTKNYNVIFTDDFKEQYFPGVEFEDEFMITIDLLDYNRVHFSAGIPEELRGKGLGYFIYKQFLKEVGYACSSDDTEPEAINIWSQLMKDPDIYGILIDSKGKGDSYVMGIHKDCKVSNMIDILKEFLEHHKERNVWGGKNKLKQIIIDDKLIEKYPELKEYV